MPNFRADMVENTVWKWLRGLIENPSNISEGLRNMQSEARYANSRIVEQIEIIDQQLDELKSQQNKLLDLFLNGDFPKSLIDERKMKIDATSRKLMEERIELSSHLNTTVLDDIQICEIEEFCASIQGKLETASFEAKRHLIEMFDVRGKLTIVDDQKFIEVSCLISPQPRSLALTSH
jgi:hypothetical protein